MAPMSKEGDYRTGAAWAMQLAEPGTTVVAQKGHLLLLAGRWLELAD
jgi:hypothetical protein